MSGQCITEELLEIHLPGAVIMDDEILGFKACLPGDDLYSDDRLSLSVMSYFRVSFCVRTNVLEGIIFSHS